MYLAKTKTYGWERPAIAAVLYAWIEMHLFSQGASAGDYIFFGQFALYHFFMLGLFTVVAFPQLRHIWLMILVEDISYHIFKGSGPGPDSWVNWILGGFWAGSLWIPNTYLLLLIIIVIVNTKAK